MPKGSFLSFAAEEKVKDRLAQLAREKLLSREKQLQLERKRRAMAFLNQINGNHSFAYFILKNMLLKSLYNTGDENSASKYTKKNDIPPATNCEKSLTKVRTENTSDHSDDSVTFVSASSSTSICAAVTQTAQKRRNTKVNRSNSSGSDDVIEIETKHSRSRSRSRSRYVNYKLNYFEFLFNFSVRFI